MGDAAQCDQLICAVRGVPVMLRHCRGPVEPCSALVPAHAAPARPGAHTISTMPPQQPTDPSPVGGSSGPNRFPFVWAATMDRYYHRRSADSQMGGHCGCCRSPPRATEQMFYNFFLLFGPRLTSTPYPYLSSVPPPITTSSAPLTSLLPDYTWTMHAWSPPLRR